MLFLAAVFCGLVSVATIPKIVKSRATVFRETTSNTYRKVFNTFHNGCCAGETNSVCMIVSFFCVSFASAPCLLSCQLPYYFAVLIADIPFQVICSALFVFPFYFMAGFRLWGPFVSLQYFSKRMGIHSFPDSPFRRWLTQQLDH